MAPFTFSGGGGGGGAVDTGWRRFMFADADTAEDPNTILDASNPYTETPGASGYTEILCSAATSGVSNVDQLGVYVLALTDGAGNAITWDKPFQLRFMIEGISLSGSYGTNSQYQKPTISFGVGVNASNIVHADNRYLSMGWVQHSATYPAGCKVVKGSKNTFSISGTTGDANTKLLIGQLYHGPDVGSSMATANNTAITSNIYKVSGSSYRRNSSQSFNRIDCGSLAANTIKGDTSQVQLYAFCGEVRGVDGSAPAPSTFKFRIWYMANQDSDGWGGSGT